MITSREQVTQRIVAEKVRRGLKWKEVAETLGQSKEWVTAACLGQMQLTKGDAENVAELFGLDNEVGLHHYHFHLDFPSHIRVTSQGQRYSFAPIQAVVWLQTVPHKSSSTIPADPLLYRFYEVPNHA
jgi:cyanate lyase